MEKAKGKILICCFIVISILSSCIRDDDGQKLNPNLFNEDYSNGAFLKVEHSSNADTIFLSWEIEETIEFDYYKVYVLEDSLIINNIEKNKCFFTNLPYNELFPVSIALLKNNQIISQITTNVEINGLDEVFARRLIPDNGSVTGGDGTYSIELPDGRSIFLMGDSFIGPVTNGARSMKDHMYRNTYILYDDPFVSAIYGTNGEKSSAAVPPGVTDEHIEWYWPGHGFVNSNKLFVFQTKMFQKETGMWGFCYKTTDILEYNLPGLELYQTVNIPFKGSSNIHFGMAVLKNNNYIYIYAQKDVDNGLIPVSDALVARTTIEKLYESWEYFDGLNWSPESTDAVKMSGLSAVAISSQFNVFKLKDKFVLLTQDKQFKSGKIYTFIADNPEGPWYNKQLIYTTLEQNHPKQFTYNAMAHPQFTKNGMILISYNVNTEDWEQLHDDVSTYRPRFFWIGTDKILGR